MSVFIGCEKSSDPEENFIFKYKIKFFNIYDTKSKGYISVASLKNTGMIELQDIVSFFSQSEIVFFRAERRIMRKFQINIYRPTFQQNISQLTFLELQDVCFLPSLYHIIKISWSKIDI